MRIFLLSVASLMMSVPLFAFAQGLVPCSGGECQMCHIALLADRIIDFLITITGILGAILFAFAGFLMVTARGNVSHVQKAKGVFLNVVVGFIILLASWLIVDTLMKMLAGDQAYGMWREITCEVLPTYTNIEHLVEEGPETGTPPGEVIIPPISGGLSSYGGYQFTNGVVNKMKYISETYNLRVSSGYRTPERNAEVNGSPTSYHLTGRAGDFVGSRADMETAATWARSNGAVEVLIHNAGSGTHLHVVF